MLMIRFRTAWLLGLFVAAAAILSAQKPSELKKSGEKYFTQGRWRDAQAQLSAYQEQKPGDPGVLFQLGISLYHLHRPAEARKYLEYLVAKDPTTANPDTWYYLARTLHGQQEFEPAIAAYKSFLRVCGERHPFRAGIPDQIRRCLSGQGMGLNEAVALVENLGDRVNSAGDEFAPLPSVNHADRLYFAAAREGATGGQRNNEGYEDPENGRWCSDMYVATLQAGGWEYEGELGSLLNTSRNEVALGFSETGQVLYFFRGFTGYSGDIFADTAGKKDEYALTRPAFSGPVQPEKGDAYPFFFNDTTLLFASRRAGGFGGLDLYYSIFSKGAWAVPQNLGPVVNTAYDETSPFLASDGKTLYFSSNHCGSMGGLDVFKTVFEDSNKGWQAPVNVGAGINSPGDDAFFRLATDRRSAFFSSDRLESFGERDLYIAYFKEEQALASEPVAALFAAKEKKSAGISERVKAGIPVMQYDTDRDILSIENLKTIDALAALARNFPETTVLVTVHSDETGPAKFDLYNGIKRAEIVGKALVERGVAAGRIALRSCGAAYPLARNVLDAAPNPIGRHLNRRIEITLAVTDGQLPLDLELQRPVVSEIMAAGGAKQLDAATAGLSYKVEIATTRQILTSDALSMFSDLMIESQPGAGAYRYTAGMFKQYQRAAPLLAEFRQQGFAEPAVIAYIDGIRVSRAEAVALVKKYPDLVAFVKG